jgi:hypothetical protein
MRDRSERREAALASAVAGAIILVCAGIVLSTAACGIKVSAQDFPALRLSAADAAAKK